MAGGAKITFYTIPVLTVSFKLILLGLIIFLALTYIAQGQATQAKVFIAVATVLVYGISDWILRSILNLLCDCENHKSL